MQHSSGNAPTEPADAGALVTETALGFVGLAWNGTGLTRLCLFDRNRSAVSQRLARLGHTVDRTPAPDWIVTLRRDIDAYASGERKDFRAVPVDLAGIDAFQLAIYGAARELGFGETTTYGELARRAGHPGLPRETGQALGANPVPLVIPCHRILAAGGRIGGFSAPGGAATKQKMLELEGLRFEPPPPPQRSFGF